MGGFLQEIGRVRIFKRNQGRITRQVTGFAIGLLVVIGAWRLSDGLHQSRWAGSLGGIQFWLPGVLMVVGLWLTYRLVNYPHFADFLIAVEAEMAKVSWPSRKELVNASIVVLVLLLLLASVLGGFDVVWGFIFRYIGLY